MPKRLKETPSFKIVQEWTLAPAATLGSAVRTKGILLEIRSRLPTSERKLVQVEGATVQLRAPEGAEINLVSAAAKIAKTLEGAEDLPVIPREVEDILGITSSERHRWLKDGRLQSAGTRTVKLRGRARKITFHVFDPRHIEDVLDRALPDVWREQDAIERAENRKRGAGKAALTRAAKARRATTAPDTQRTNLKGWDDFDLDGLLR